MENMKTTVGVQMSKQDNVEKEVELTPERIEELYGVILVRKKPGTKKRGNRRKTGIMTRNLVVKTLRRRELSLRDYAKPPRWARWPQYSLEKILCHWCGSEIKENDRYYPGSRATQALTKFYCVSCGDRRN